MSKKGNEPAFPGNFSREIERSKSNKSELEYLWDYCLLFLEGKQWLWFTKDQRRFNLDSRGGTKKVTINLLINLYRAILSRLSLNYPSVTVLPGSPSSEDIAKAKSSDLALQYYWTQQKLKHKMRDMFAWGITCGNCAIHTYFSREDEDVRSDVISPFDLFYEDGVSTIEEARWVAIRSIVHRDDLKAKYPDKASAINRMSTGERPNERRVEDIGTHSPSVGPAEDRLEVYEVYWRDGRHGIVVNDLWLWKGEWDLPEMPVQHYRYTEVPGMLWGIGVLEQVLDLQYLYNKRRGQLMENIDLNSNIRWFVPKNSGIPKNSMTNRPGEIIPFNPAGGPPIPIESPSMAPQIFDDLDRMVQEISDVSGLHSTSFGKRVAGINSGRAIEELSTQDQSHLGISQEMAEELVANLSRVVLSLMKQHYSEQKMMRMMDSTGGVVFHYLSGTDLVDDPEVFIQGGTMFRTDAEERDRRVLRNLEIGAITPEDAKDQMSERPGDRDGIEKLATTKHAQELLEAAKQGATIEIFPSDDIEVFEQVWGEYIRSPEYYELPPNPLGAQTRQQVIPVTGPAGELISQQVLDVPIAPGEYIRDVYMALITFGQPYPVYEEARAAKVFPRTPEAGMGPANAMQQQEHQANSRAQDQHPGRAPTAPPLPGVVPPGGMSGMGGSV